MRRFFVTSVLMVGVLTVGWSYAPDGMREKLLGFAGLANFGAITQALRDAVIPESPVARRASSTDALKQKIGAIRAGIAGAQNSGSPEASFVLMEDAEKAADEAVKIIDQLEEANDDQSLGGRVAARVIDAVLPAPPSAQCVEP